jgi:Protein of unknown function (DUF455)
VRNNLPVEELARDERFHRVKIEDVVFDPRNASRPRQTRNGFQPDNPDAPDGARQLMHAIFVGEIQALEVAGRTCWDFPTGKGADEAPFELKLDMARQAWDEARHVEISIKLSEHMGSEIGEFAEQTMLYEAGCNSDPVLRLTGVNRALEGLAIDVFNTMDWLRRITAKDPERQKGALEFQRTVDKLFSFGGFRGEDDESPVHLARKFRALAGFSPEEIKDLVDISAEAYAEAQARAAAGEPAPEPTPA